ncbi:hypothetical protein GJW-30_1_00065 [Variibacter gotjawalensis]|uniref:DUF3102 domain-containing protein n=1 Tax=Variibacter gotjawalensis TaxID=1333996 RepID=A0A0S3PNN2_9BRAD|nr:DUF3102 domain-containing protein [Variibacter gotjawalensis]NIK47843.1 hypothetical protein [Variibacter gotjawalensis]RZS49731.1 DUF3102 family protein [Variibacter gotjawalensis]BAT57559.1 hypothetical protein GJW-30_1_00065 [Variibacter gotjawalensis]
MPLTLPTKKHVAPSLLLLKGEKPTGSPETLGIITERIKARLIDSTIETGRDLLKAKTLIPHGQFQAWIKDNFGWSASLAQKLMNIAEDPKSVQFMDLPKVAQYALAAPSTPTAAKEAVAEEIESGKKPSTKRVKEIIKKAKGKSAALPAYVPSDPEANSEHDIKISLVPGEDGNEDFQTDHVIAVLKQATFSVSAVAFEKAFPYARVELIDPGAASA